MQKDKDRLWVPGVWAALLLSVVMFGMLVSGWAQRMNRLERKRGDLDQMLRHVRRVEGYRQVREQLARHAGRPAFSPQDFFRASKVGTALGDVRQAAMDLGDGLLLRRYELEFRDVPLGGLFDVLRALEAQEPLWRVARMAVSSSSPEGGRGQVTVSLEQLFLTDPASGPRPAVSP